MIPNSTYRIQLHEAFNFNNLDTILEYLHELGISTIYASPITRAIKGSQHGYDVADPLLINPEIGSEMQLEKLSRRLKEYGMTWLQDIVPNHMAFTQSNEWLYDVLERGKASEYYCFFDIDTDLSGDLIGHKLMVPFLGNTLTECLQRGELTLQFAEKGFVIRYFDQDYPVAIPSYRWICTVTTGCPPELLTSLEALVYESHAMHADWQTARRKWLSALNSGAEAQSFIRRQIAFFNDRPSLLEDLLDNQHYILTHSHLAASRINYRRFFTVNSLICLRMEDERVFSTWHVKIREWFEKGYFQGLRVDHIDGLAAPRAYLADCRSLFGPSCYLVAEKILAASEPLATDWEIQGTTGYEFLACVGQLLADPDGLATLKDFYKEKIAPDKADYKTLVFDNKYRFLKTQMGGELNNLVELLYTRFRPTGELPGKEQIKEALSLVMAAFPVYRIYPETTPLPDQSVRYLQQAFAKARDKRSDLTEVIALLERSLENPRFFSRLMQFTGPLAAKGIEDTSFYNYNALIAFNEVGDTPGKKGLTVDEFHEKMIRRQRDWPHALNAGSTHDTKRGEDARMRLQALTAIPQEWINAVEGWKVLNAPFIRQVNNAPAPSPNDEYFIYQSLLGGFPADLFVTDEFRQRFHDFLTKALREGKDTTSWDKPDENYERACHDFVQYLLQADSPFLEVFIPFAWSCIQQGMDLSLSQLLLRLTAPGIPDIYQGAECWECSFVDPDNRRPVDYELRKRLLHTIKQEEEGLPELLQNHKKEGAPKLFTLYKTLTWRNQYPQVFSSGDYIPVEISGAFIAYIRRCDPHWALVIVPLVRQQADAPASPVLVLPAGAPAEWKDLFSGEKLSATDRTLSPGDVLSKFPVTLLTASIL